MKLSIITVNLNNKLGLEKTLRSIESQSFQSYEHIIIDAKSTDGSLQTIIEYSQRTSRLHFWVSEPDKGIYDGMNKGIKNATGEYLYFLNSGDCLTPEILQRIPFDGTQYIYGNTIVKTQAKEESKTYPNIPDFIYLSNNSLAHQTCFIHRTLFSDKEYDTNYRIIADWVHCFESIILERCSYKHIPLTISICDGNGVSYHYDKLEEDRIKWFKEKFPESLSKGFINCMALDKSTFRDILPTIAMTRQFKKRIKKLIMLLYDIHRFFSCKK